jgi:hypothetical protein
MAIVGIEPALHGTSFEVVHRHRFDLGPAGIGLVQRFVMFQAGRPRFGFPEISDHDPDSLKIAGRMLSRTPKRTEGLTIGFVEVSPHGAVLWYLAPLGLRSPTGFGDAGWQAG